MMRVRLLLMGLCATACADAASEPPGASLTPALADRYAGACANCHEAGAADAPRRGDEADWARRRERGLTTLVDRVRTGTLAMPPRGLCYTCSDAELEALAAYVSGGRGTP